MRSSIAWVVTLVLAGATVACGFGRTGGLCAGRPSDHLPAVHVTGTMLEREDTDGDAWVEAATWEVSDARLSGDATYVSERTDIGWGAADAWVAAGSYEIVNDDGRWVGTATEFNATDAGLHVRTILLQGEGGHDGLAASLVLYVADGPPEIPRIGSLASDRREAGDAFRGVLFPGKLPRLAGPDLKPRRHARSAVVDSTPAFVSGYVGGRSGKKRSSDSPGKDFWGWGYAEASDARLRGDVWYRDLGGTWFGPGATGCVCNAGVGTGIFVVDNPGGRWVGTATQVGEDCFDLRGHTIQLSGEGSYDGLTAYLVLGVEDDRQAFEGLIFPGTMPRGPELTNEGIHDS